MFVGRQGATEKSRRRKIHIKALCHHAIIITEISDIIAEHFVWVQHDEKIRCPLVQCILLKFNSYEVAETKCLCVITLWIEASQDLYENISDTYFDCV